MIAIGIERFQPMAAQGQTETLPSESERDGESNGSGMRRDGFLANPRSRTSRPPAGVPADMPIAVGRIGDGSLAEDIEAIVREAAVRISDWTPKGVHFAWERSFRNKGKFLATMNKDEARALVRETLLATPLLVFANRREGKRAPNEFRIVADLGRVIGSRGQRRIRIVLTRDARGYLIDNAFPVHCE